jgi:hypothetical protein
MSGLSAQQKAEAFLARGGGQLGAEDIGERGEEIGLVHELVAGA